MAFLAAVFVIYVNVFIPGLRGYTTIVPPAGSPLGHEKREASHIGRGQQEIRGLTGSRRLVNFYGACRH